MKFRVISADPPWLYDDKLAMSSVKRGADSQYSTLTLADIMSCGVSCVAADDAVLFLWVGGPFVEDALSVMKAWGFKCVQWAGWVKTTKNGLLHFGMGRIFRYSGELALVGVRGNPKRFLKVRNQRNIFVGRSLKPHSRKTHAFHKRLDRMFDGPKLEMFARQQYPRWTCVGLELNGEDVRDSITRLRDLPQPTR